jgi:hypothetical protein
MQKRKILIPAGIAALVLGGGTAAYAATAAIPGQGGVIAGCYVKSGGTLRSSTPPSPPARKTRPASTGIRQDPPGRPGRPGRRA